MKAKADNATLFAFLLEKSMFKEKGYDAFLAEQIRVGREQVKTGQGIPLEIAKQQIKAKFKAKIKAA